MKKIDHMRIINNKYKVCSLYLAYANSTLVNVLHSYQRYFFLIIYYLYFWK